VGDMKRVIFEGRLPVLVHNRFQTCLYANSSSKKDCVGGRSPGHVAAVALLQGRRISWRVCCYHGDDQGDIGYPSHTSITFRPGLLG
jgi:hypothetical protein